MKIKKTTGLKRTTSKVKSKIKTVKVIKPKLVRKPMKKTALKKRKTSINKVIDEKLVLKELSFLDMIPMSYDDVVIHDDNGIHCLTIAPYYSKDKLKMWFKGRGGIFSKDYRKFLKQDITIGKYVLIENEVEKLIVRLIEEHEVDDFKSAKFIDGQITDKPYMLFKKLNKNQKLTSTEISDVDLSLRETIGFTVTPEGEGIILFADEEIH